jgi:hypothetical protein
VNTADIQAMQRRLGVPADGFWGPVSQGALRTYLRQIMPNPHPWPRADRASMEAFYGAAGDETNLTNLVPPYPMFYDGQRIKTLRCHVKVAASLLRVLTAIGQSYSQSRGILEEAEDYGGCFNFRNKRGGTSLSIHSWGAAIDLDADDNTFRDHWPMQADMPLEIMEAFAREGWLSAGAFWGYDAMHFQATR